MSGFSFFRVLCILLLALLKYAALPYSLLIAIVEGQKHRAAICKARGPLLVFSYQHGAECSALYALLQWKKLRTAL